MTTADVSREALAEPGCAERRRRYRSPARQSKGERTQASLLAAALGFVGEGRFRPQAKDIAARAGVHKSQVTRHFGAVDLLYRVIARGHFGRVCEAALGPERAAALTERAQAELAWLIMAGTRPERP